MIKKTVFLAAFALLLPLLAAADKTSIYDRRALMAPGAETSDDPRRIPLAPGANAPDSLLVLQGGRLFDSTGAAARPATLVVKGKTIAAILPSDSRDLPPGATLIDVTGKTVMPGLIDMHVHMTYEDPQWDGGDTDADATLRAVERLRYYIESGITTVRDTGSRGMVPFRIKRWVAANRLPLPRVFAAGELITGKGGHGAEKLVNSPNIREASGPDDWRQAVREQFEKGADFIKLASHYSKEEVAAAIDEAHALGLRVTVDAENIYIQWAVEAGVDMVEHPLPRPDKTIKLMAKNNVGSIPTLVPYIYIIDQWGGYFGSTSRRFTLTKEGNFAMLQKLKKAGVKLGVGADLVLDWYRYLPAPYITELELYTAAGFTTEEALIAATRTNAELLDMDDKLGTLETGKLADILVVDGIPDKNLGDLAKVDLVIRNGIVVVRDGRLAIPRHVPMPVPEGQANTQ